MDEPMFLTLEAYLQHRLEDARRRPRESDPALLQAGLDGYTEGLPSQPPAGTQ